MQGALTVLAHQGGWDEMLYVAVPIGVFVVLLRLANKRAEQKLAERASAEDHPDATAPHPAKPSPSEPDAR